MFIYLKSAAEPSKNRYVINKITDGKCRYFEVVLSDRVTARTVKRAVKRCKGALPLATENVPLPHKLEHRRVDNEPFDKILLINAFCEIIAGYSSALVCDPRGEIAEFLLKPLTRVGTLYVLTERPDIYAAAGAHSLRTVGSSPILISGTDGIEVTAALNLGGGTPRAQIVLGKGGFLPCGERVLVCGRAESRALCAAKYCVFGSADVRSALPERLKNNTFTATPSQLKRMLDTESCANYN